MNTVLANNFSELNIVGNQLQLTITHNFSDLDGLDPNASASGEALDDSVGNAEAQDFIGALDNSDLLTVQATLNGAVPNAGFGTSVAIVSGNHRLNRWCPDHLALTRAGDDAMHHNVGTYSAPAPAPQVRTPVLETSGARVSYAWNDIDSDFGGDFDGEEASFTAGVDYRISSDFLLGILLDGSTADYDFTGGGSDVDSFRGAIYGTYGAANRHLRRFPRRIRNP